MKTLPLGTISHGTMRPEDLIMAFVEALREVCPEHLIVEEYDEMGDSAYAIFVETEECDWFIESLFDALNEYCPPYCYFGASEGDGADYGCWINWDDVDENFEMNGTDPDFARIPAGGPWPCVPEILEVNDHGNATLWIWDADEHRHVEAWSVV